jgi:hypothetical protein
MARRVDDLVIFMKNSFIEKAYEIEPRLTPLLFNEKDFNETKPLKIGYYYDAHFFDICPTGKRIVDETVSFLKSKGHDVKPFIVP